MKISIKRAIAVLLTTICLMFSAQAPAHAGVNVAIGGDSNWKVTATAITNRDTAKKGQSVTGTAKIEFEARVLGIPMPTTGHYSNSFPATFERPTLESADGDLDSFSYSKVYNAYLKSQQWEARGSSFFFGEKKVTIKGKSEAC